MAKLPAQVVEQLDEVALQRVRPALAVLTVVLTEEAVQQRGVRDREVTLDALGRHPLVQDLGRAHVSTDGRFLIRSPELVVGRPQVVLELGTRRGAIGQCRPQRRRSKSIGLTNRASRTAGWRADS